MRTSRLIDATEGSVVKKILLYTFPLVISLLVQTLFSAADIVVLGNFADNNAVASIGATTTIINLIVQTFIGLSGGTKILLARSYGARDERAIRTMTDTSLIAALFIGVFVAGFGIIFAPDFLRMTRCPEECFEGAVIYLRIYVASAPFIMLYNFGSSVLTASGDTQRPLYYIMAGGALNLVLNVLLCLILPEKIVAVAVATVASQVLGAVLVLSRLTRMEAYGRLSPRHMTFSSTALWQMLRFGTPIALSSALYPLASLQIQSAINDFGVAATAGTSAAVTLEGFTAAFVVPFGTTVATFVGQNIGAGKPERVRRSVLHCLWMAPLSGVVFGMGVYLLGRPLLLPMILGADEAAITYGAIRLFFINGFYFIAGLNQVLGGTIQAYGHSMLSSLNSVVSVLIFRIVWMTWIYPLYSTFVCLIFCFTVSWTFMLLINILCYVVIAAKERRRAAAVSAHAV